MKSGVYQGPISINRSGLTQNVEPGHDEGTSRDLGTLEQNVKHCLTGESL